MYAMSPSIEKKPLAAAQTAFAVVAQLIAVFSLGKEGAVVAPDLPNIENKNNKK